MVYQTHNERLDRYSNERARFPMRIRNVGLALVLSASMLWAQDTVSPIPGGPNSDPQYERNRRMSGALREGGMSPAEARRGLKRRLEKAAEPKVNKAHKEFKKARKDVRKKKYEKALRRLKKATEIYPHYTEAFYEMGRIYLLQNRKEETRKAFEQAIVANSKWVHSYVDPAALQQFDNQPQQLLEISNEILRAYPTLSVGHFLHSYANLSMGRVEEAEKSALVADGYEHRQVAHIHLMLAQVYRHQGKLEEAEKQLRTFLEESPNAPAAHWIWTKAELEMVEQRREVEQELGKKRVAREKMEKLNQLFANGVGAMKTHNYEVAIAQFDEAAQLAPEQSAVFASLGDAYTGAGTAKRGSDAQALYEKAIEAYEKAVALKPDAPGYHNNLGRVLAFAGNVEWAKKELSTAAALDPTNGGKYFYNLGAVLSNGGRKEEAIEAFRKATEVDPNYAMAWYQLGLRLSADATVDEKTGKSITPPGTIEALQKYLELEPEGRFAAAARSRIHVSTASR